MMGLASNFSRFADEALRLLPVLRLDVEGDAFANAHVGQLSEAEHGQIVGDGLALRIEEGGQRENVDGGEKTMGYVEDGGG